MTDSIQIRKYSSTDLGALLNLFSLNVPQGFAAEEVEDYIGYLENDSDNYWVLEEGGRVMGGGGINLVEGEKMAKISWDLLHPQKQNQGLGKRLLKFRIDFIQLLPQIETIVVRTSQMAFLFYQKCGFKVMEVQENYWADGYHLYYMLYEPNF